MTVIPIEFATPEYDEAVKLRYNVLREPLGLDFMPEFLAVEYKDTHLACYDERYTLLGCLILSTTTSGYFKMRQVAVADEWQGRGVGRKLVEASETLARSLHIPKIELNARATAIPFYSKLYYTKVGEPFMEVGISHLKMEKLLSI